MGEKVFFNTNTKTVEVTANTVFENGEWVIDLDVQVDLYSDGKEDWATGEPYTKFIFPVRSVGGDPLPGSKNLGDTYFLASDWKIKPYEASHVFRVNGNIYSEDGTSPFTQTTGTFNVQIINTVSNLVDSTVQQLKEIEYASFGDSVWVDITSSNALNGADPLDELIGNAQNPVNNITDAKLIQAARGLPKRIQLIGDITIESTDDIDGFDIIGESISRSDITLTSGCSTSDTSFEKCTITGDADGAVNFTECYVVSVTGVGGASNDMTWRRCQFEGTTQLKSDNIVSLHVLDCRSGVAGSGTPILDVNNTLTDIDYRGYIGGIELTNSNQNISCSLDVEGHVKLQSTITNGEFVVRGRGKKTISGTANIDDENYLQTSTIQDSIERTTYIGKEGSGVSVSPLNGTDSIVWPYGTRQDPCKTEMNFHMISEANGLKNIYVQDSITLNGDHSVGHTFFGDNPQTVNINLGANTDVSNCKFQDCYVTGKLDSFNILWECVVGSITNGNGFIYQSTCIGPIVISDNVSMENCWIAPTATNQECIIDFNNLAKSVIISNWSAGRIRVKNMVTGSFIGLSGTGGRLVIDQVNSGGTAVYAGAIGVDDTYESSIDTLNDSTTSSQVWDKTANNHIISGSTGEVLSAGGSTSITQTDIDNISNAVWNKLLADMIVADSAGDRLQALLTVNKYLGLK